MGSLRWGGTTAQPRRRPVAQSDFEMASCALRARPRYVGVIGSRRKAVALRQHLAADGHPAELIDTVRTPVGVDIGAETPAEIAVSVVAELIAVRRKGGA